MPVPQPYASIMVLSYTLGVTVQAVWSHAPAQRWQGAMTTQTL